MHLKIKIFNIDMAKLAIKGHKTRGKEVIEILEMLGGINSNNFYGDKGYAYYIVDSNKEIKGSSYSYGDEILYHFTLEEFLEKFPYKVGDKVIIKSKNKEAIIDKVIWSCDTITYWLKYDGFIEGNWRAEHLQPYKEETIETITIDDFKANTKEWLIDKLESMSKDNALQTINNIYDELHKPKYPKTYEECCKVLGYSGNYDITVTTDVDNKLFNALYRLKICRDAYWKIAGEQRGLGKPWKPDWTKANLRKYCFVNTEGSITKWVQKTTNKILAFPTEEMRDAFYENFKDLIEQCKELL